MSQISVSTARFSATSALDSGGLVKGVSVISAGEAKGHDLFIDEASLRGFLSAATARGPGGVQVKLEHSSGIDKIIGAIKNFRIDGQQLRGDMQLLKSHPFYQRATELIANQPQSFGLSVAFNFTAEEIGGRKFARPTYLWSVDLVDHPAANPGGLFSSSPNLDRLKITADFIARFSEADAQRVLSLPDDEQVSEMQRMLALPMTPLERVELEFRRQLNSRQQSKPDPAIAALSGLAKTEAIFKQQLDRRKK